MRNLTGKIYLWPKPKSLKHCVVDLSSPMIKMVVTMVAAAVATVATVPAVVSMVVAVMHIVIITATVNLLWQ